jgi:hypothetical protein
MGASGYHTTVACNLYVLLYKGSNGRCEEISHVMVPGTLGGNVVRAPFSLLSETFWLRGGSTLFHLQAARTHTHGRCSQQTESCQPSQLSHLTHTRTPYYVYEQERRDATNQTNEKPKENTLHMIGMEWQYTGTITAGTGIACCFSTGLSPSGRFGVADLELVHG